MGSSPAQALPGVAGDRPLATGAPPPPLESTPDQVASTLSRYYHGVGTFNKEAAPRERLLQKLFNVTGPATAGIFKSVSPATNDWSRGSRRGRPDWRC